MSGLVRASLALALAAALAACANAVPPAPPVAAGGRGTLSGVDDAAFGLRTRTPGFTADRAFSGAGA